MLRRDLVKPTASLDPVSVSHQPWDISLHCPQGIRQMLIGLALLWAKSKFNEDRLSPWTEDTLEACSEC